MKKWVLAAQSRLTLCDPMDCSPPGSSVLVEWNSPGKNTGVGSHSLLQGSSQPRDRTWVSLVAGRFFTIWAPRETQKTLGATFKSLTPSIRVKPLMNFSPLWHQLRFTSVLPAVQKTWVWSLGQEDPWRREWLPPPFLPGEFQGQRSLAGYGPWGHKELDMTEWLTLFTNPYPNSTWAFLICTKDKWNRYQTKNISLDPHTKSLSTKAFNHHVIIFRVRKLRIKLKYICNSISIFLKHTLPVITKLSPSRLQIHKYVFPFFLLFLPFLHETLHHVNS